MRQWNWILLGVLISGATAHFSAEFFKKQAGGLQMVYVPYKGKGQSVLNVIGGQIPLVFTVVGG